MNTFNLSLLVLVVVLVVGWFAAGTQFNVRRGHKALAWLQPSLKLRGEKTTLRWLGSSVVEMKIATAHTPFRRADVLVVLEPRDVPFLWWSARLMGRRDLLIVRGELEHAPRFEFEAFDPHAWTGRGLEAKLKLRNWDPVPLSPPLVGYSAAKAPLAELQPLLAIPGLVRLSFRRTAAAAGAGAPPRGTDHFELHCRLSAIQAHPAAELFEKLRAAVPAATARASRS
jgi:hypothetical protein